ncbi:hypothetical protein MRB53_030487 [Persea americana]|uniref:Uncharacterized protein n=1 Tax=Persea americana TaxID=3435 RepID=A0ACC2KM05_PERAE|nr:hypothetical protein MRB53_030487 [Persea americana]
MLKCSGSSPIPDEHPKHQRPLPAKSTLATVFSQFRVSNSGDVGLRHRLLLEAAAALLAQLQVLKAEEKEMKRRRKEEKAAMKAAQMKAMGDCNNSSSSSFESSNSECGKVADMSCLRSGAHA